MLIKFKTYFDGDSWCARGIGVDIFTQGKTLDKLMANVKEAVAIHFEEEINQNQVIKILTISETEVGNVPEIAQG